MTIKYLSLFSGIGGFELGIQQAYDSLQNNAGLQGSEHQGEDSASKQSGLDANQSNRLGHPVCIGFSEIDKYAVQIYEKHFNHKNYGDITKLDPATLPDFDLICGGFPCQAFSIAGKRRGFEDTRGTLFFEIARILQTKRPRLLLLENVKGLLSHDNGFTFKTIIATLAELGYDLQWQVLNSKNFGVPQNRERVFIVGHLRGTARPKVFPLTENDGLSTERQRQIFPTITQRYYKQGQSDPYIVSEESESGEQSLQQEGNKSDSSNGRGRTAHPSNLRIRRLTPKDCDRLQGFPDDWTAGISDTQRYKCLGNAVTVNVIQEIIKRLS